MGQTIGELLPLAIGVAISVVPIIAIILMLITPKAGVNGTAFLVGWLAGLAVVGTTVLVVAGSAGVATSSGPTKAVSVTELILGALFLLLAGKQWKSRPKAGAEPSMPKWMGSIDSFAPGKALILGALLSGVNPKNLILTATASATIAQAGLPGGEEAVVLVVFILLASLTIIAPLAVYLVLGERAAAVLEEWKAWLSQNNATIMFVLFLVFGAVLIGKGISGLAT